MPTEFRDGAISWDWLRTFDACARHGSFTRAAAELGLTTSTVSTQMAALEGQLRTTLFIRKPRGVVPTAAALGLLPAIGAARAALVPAIRAVMEGGARTLRISSIGDFGAYWLLPRIPAFEAANPDIRVELDTGSSLVEPAQDGFDLCVRHGFGTWPGLVAERIAPWRLVPLATPGLAARVGGDADRLFAERLLSIDRQWWTLWAEAAGRPGLPPRADLSLWNTQLLVAQATLAGLGVGLLSPFIMAGPVGSGALAPAHGCVLEHPSAHFLAAPPQSWRIPEVRRFADWLLAEAGMAA